MHTMKTMSAVEAKTHFGQFLDNAQRAPVLVTKKNRPVAMMLSIQDAQKTIWGKEVVEGGNLSEFEGKIKSFAALDDAVEWQQKIRKNW